MCMYIFYVYVQVCRCVWAGYICKCVQVCVYPRMCVQMYMNGEGVAYVCTPIHVEAKQ